MSRDPVRVVVIGGGLAGAASAWALTRRGHRVTLVEREERLGAHASGRNAGLIRRVVEDPAIAQLAREGAELLAEPPEDLAEAASGQALVRRTGSILLAGPEGAADLRRMAFQARAAGVYSRRTRPDRAGDLLGLDLPGENGVAVLTPKDGVADPHTILSALLEAARVRGAQVRTGAAGRIVSKPSGVSAVEVGDELLTAEVIVNAAGPWAADLAREAGGLPIELNSFRRHLFSTGPLPEVSSEAAWVWDVERGFYLRPESGGLLVCACDAEPRPPEDTVATSDASVVLAEKMERLATGLAHLPIASAWAGLRTFAVDRRFVIGWDPELRGLFWVAGLGGHGLTTCCAVGELVAEALEGQVAMARLRAFDPARFIRQGTSGGTR